VPQVLVMKNPGSPPGSTLRGFARRGYRWLTARSARAPEFPSGAAWDRQYAAGRWSYLEQLPELARYSVLTGYIAHLKPYAAVLDVGCGEGVLLKRLSPHGYRRYLGVDLSAVAIEKLQDRRDEKTTFLAADGEYYTPTERFDVVVCNEVLYFFRDPLAAVARYCNALTPGGLLLVSTCTGFKRGLPILADLKEAYALVDETRVSHGDDDWAWICTVLAPRA
jgi:2-polyprenyl-3-methyl-5-hydroxy-6-metoxy-1,4-benzoquinol methylase